MLVRVRETGPVSASRIFTSTRLGPDSPCTWHHKDIEHVTNTRSTQMGVAKSHDRIVRVVVSGTPVPSLVIRVRAELHHAVRDSGPWITVPMTASTDTDVDISRHTFRIGFCASRELRSRNRRQGVGIADSHAKSSRAESHELPPG